MAFTAVLVLLLLVATAAASPPLTPQDRLWLASVDHTITKDERKQYESLDETARRAFQEAFWRSRDPRPDTPQNEALEEYVERLQFVEQYFQENEVPGVFTERGRMYMHFGKPAYRKIADMPARAGGSMSGSRRAWADGNVPVEIWVYDSPPASKPGKYRVITFVDENKTNRFGVLNDELKPLQPGRKQ
jgi:GWxTD domain-containing protein